MCPLHAVMLAAVTTRRRHPNMLNHTIRFLMMLPIIIPTLVGALGLLILYDRAGWINFFLVRALHVLKEFVLVDYTIPGLVIFYLWMFFPYPIRSRGARRAAAQALVTMGIASASGTDLTTVARER